VAVLKKKWTNIKDSFVKDIRGRLSREATARQKKYYLFDHLQFLKPIILDYKSIRHGGHKRPRTISVTATENETTAQRETSTQSTNVSSSVSAAQAIKSSKTAISEIVMQPNLLFIKSLIPTIMSLNEIQNLDFKIGFLQLLARIKYNQSVDLPDIPVAEAPVLHKDISVPNQPVNIAKQAAELTTNFHSKHSRKPVPGLMKLFEVKKEEDITDDLALPNTCYDEYL